MKAYLFRTNALIRFLFPHFLWRKKTLEKTVFLTFDDGPTPEITPWVLHELDKYDANATFFCIGQNIANHNDLFKVLVESRHLIGNHTYEHQNGWKTANETYIDSIKRCSHEITKFRFDKWFRPPYGKVRKSQARIIRKLGFQIIMWDIISGDYDTNFAPEDCLKNVISKIRPGSIIVFHDSVKAYPNLRYVLPKTLEYLKNNGYKCAALNEDITAAPAQD